VIITFIYDAIAFCFRRNGDSAFAVIADATTAMNAKELRDAGQYLLALADNREVKP
jgi:hypothetical protein